MASQSLTQQITYSGTPLSLPTAATPLNLATAAYIQRQHRSTYQFTYSGNSRYPFHGHGFGTKLVHSKMTPKKITNKV